MKRSEGTSTILRNTHRVAIIGGGPAGSFLAIHLLRGAKAAGRDIRVTIIEKDPGAGFPRFSRPTRTLGVHRACAGIVSPRLYAAMTRIGMEPPVDLIWEDFTHVWFHGLWKNFPLRVPPVRKMVSVFRGSPPDHDGTAPAGFDGFLLAKAKSEGARLVAGTVRNIRYSPARKPVLTVMTPSGEPIFMEFEFVALATGINAEPLDRCGSGGCFAAFRRINPRFRPPKVRRAMVFELKPGRTYLRRHMNRELYFIKSGSGALRLDYIALVPKGDYLTIVLVGDAIDRAVLPRDTRAIYGALLTLLHGRHLLPGMTPRSAPLLRASPALMATHPATAPFADRIAVVGDALGARIFRNGLLTAFLSAETLAETVLHRGTDKERLREGCGPMVRRLASDNRYGALVFGLIRIAFRSPLISRIVYQTFATEMKSKEMAGWPLGRVLRHIALGTADYEEILRELAGPAVIRSIFTGAAKTFRNMLTECFFGIRWRTYGRYPTVILKEKRPYFKTGIAAPLGIQLDASPEMERMYAIKIRAPAEAIFKELGKFGDPDSAFLKLRFVEVARVSGSPNTVGAVVRYRLRMAPVAMDIRLARCIPDRSLLYEPAELFALRGRLLFDITPTRDGNHRLVVYTAFDFRKGNHPLGRIFWRALRWLFPEYAHDVVWNHAVCAIKAEAERRAGC